MIKQPGANEMEELGEELDGQRMVDPAAAEESHGVH